MKIWTGRRRDHGPGSKKAVRTWEQHTVESQEVNKDFGPEVSQAVILKWILFLSLQGRAHVDLLYETQAKEKRPKPTFISGRVNNETTYDDLKC